MDDELRSMDAIATILAELEPEVADRVIRWAADRHGSGVYLSGADLEALETASRVGDDLPDGGAPTPAAGGAGGSDKVRPLKPTTHAPSRPESGAAGAAGAGPETGAPEEADVEPLTRVVKESGERESEGDDEARKASGGDDGPGDPGDPEAPAASPEKRAPAAPETGSSAAGSGEGKPSGRSDGKSGEPEKEAKSHQEKDPERPSFLDTQYRMSVAKNLIKKKEEEDEES